MTFAKLKFLYEEAQEIYKSELSWDAKCDLIIMDIGEETRLVYSEKDLPYTTAEDTLKRYMEKFSEYMGDTTFPWFESGIKKVE